MNTAAGSHSTASRLASVVAARVAAMIPTSPVHAAGPAPGHLPLAATSAAGTVN